MEKPDENLPPGDSEGPGSETEKKEPLKLEKGDLLAIFIAAAIVFFPIFLGLGFVVFLVWLILF